MEVTKLWNQTKKLMIKFMKKYKETGLLKLQFILKSTMDSYLQTK